MLPRLMRSAPSLPLLLRRNMRAICKTGSPFSNRKYIITSLLKWSWNKTLAGSAFRGGFLSIFLGVFLGACAPLVPTPPTPDLLRLRVIAFNDFHGHLQTPSPLRMSDPAVAARTVMVNAGGAAHLASAIQAARADQMHSIVVAAGDLVSASPLISSLFLDEPAIETLNALGLEISSVGNHEFDRGKDELLRLLKGGCHAQGCVTGRSYGGAKFAYLAANVRDTATGKTFLPPYTVREFSGIPVAFIGLVLKETPSIVSKSCIAGLRFDDEAYTVNALVVELRTRGVKAIVVLIHQGATTSGAYDDLTCPGMKGDIINVVERFDTAVDLVVSAHTHQAYLCRVNGIPVTSAGSYGRFLSEIDLYIDRNTHDVVKSRANNVLVDTEKFPADAQVAALVSTYAALAAPRADRVVGHIKAELAASANAAGESALGNVIADAQLAATRAAGAQLAFMNPGGIRAPLLFKTPDGGVSFGDLFTVQPFGNNLVTMTLTGEQIRRLLEQQFAPAADQRVRVLQVSQGFTYTWNASQPAGSRVAAGSILLNGEALRAQQDYRVTVNSFMADGGDGFTLLSESRDREGGMLDVDALEAYLHVNSPLNTPRPGRIVRTE